LRAWRDCFTIVPVVGSSSNAVRLFINKNVLKKIKIIFFKNKNKKIIFLFKKKLFFLSFSENVLKF